MIARLILGFFLAAQVFAAEPHGEEHAAEHEEGLASVLAHHITNEQYEHPVLATLGISKAVLMMLIAAAALIGMFALAMRASRLEGTPKGLRNALEAMVVFIRDEIAYNSMGKKWGRQFTPFLCTLFFFILACNLLGLFPYGYTATSNLNVTAILALTTLVLIVVMGMVAMGPLGYFKHMVPPTAPVFLAPLLIVIELLSLLVKPVALTIRLVANMTAGHIVIIVMLGFIFVFQSFLVAPLAVPLAVAITLLEIIVAFIQAYVFTLLTSMFIGMVVHPAH